MHLQDLFIPPLVIAVLWLTLFGCAWLEERLAPSSTEATADDLFAITSLTATPAPAEKTAARANETPALAPVLRHPAA
jgi:hypothetical protein